MAEKKSFTEIVIMPLMLIVVGGLSTYFITGYQTKHTIAMSEAQREAAKDLAEAQVESAERTANRQQAVKVLEIFKEKITSIEPKDRQLAVRLLRAVDPVLGRTLASEIAKGDSNSKVKKVAEMVARDAFIAEVNQLIEAFSGAGRRTASSKLTSLYNNASEKDQEFIVNSLFDALVPENDPSSYRVNIYIALTLSRLQPHMPLNENQKNKIVSLTDRKNYKNDPTFKLRIDQAMKNFNVPPET